MIKYDHKEFERITVAFPYLRYERKRNSIKGVMAFYARYINTGHMHAPRWEIESCEPDAHDCVASEYLIEIDFNNRDENGLPKVYEIGGKIQKCKRRLNIQSNANVHLYKDGSCCLDLYLREEASKLSLYKFVVENIYPYFVWQAYFDKYEKEPPCGSLPHSSHKAIAARINKTKNDLNILRHEQRAEPRSSNRNKPCPCGSGKKYKKCCFAIDQSKETDIIEKERILKLLREYGVNLQNKLASK